MSDRYKIGSLNPHASREGVMDYKVDTTDKEASITKFHEHFREAHSKNTHHGVSKYRAIVISQPNSPIGKCNGTLQPSTSDLRYTFHIRIPEIHSMIPDPCAMTPSLCDENLEPRVQAVIKLHPLAKSADLAPEAQNANQSGQGALPMPNVGDIIWVTYEKSPSGGRTGSPIYTGICDKSAARAARGDGAANNMSMTCDALRELFRDATNAKAQVGSQARGGSYSAGGGGSGGSGGSIPRPSSSNYVAHNKPTPPTEAQQAAADALGVPYQVIQAIEAVESGGRASAVRFEPHLWHRNYKKYGLTEAQRDQMPFTRNNQVPFSKVGSETNEAAFNKAMEVSPALAVASTSFGLYQVMGYNFENYRNTATEKVAAFRADPEGVSYDLLLKWFAASPPAQKAAKDLNWEELARRYNGPANVAVYAPRLSRQYAAFSGTTSVI